MPDVIEVENLHKRYGPTVAVDDVSFSVRQGEIVGLLGRNGASKTTTVECLVGLRAADRGRITVLGRDPLRDHAELTRRVGVQLQDGQLPAAAPGARSANALGAAVFYPLVFGLPAGRPGGGLGMTACTERHSAAPGDGMSGVAGKACLHRSLGQGRFLAAARRRRCRRETRVLILCSASLTETLCARGGGPAVHHRGHGPDQHPCQARCRGPGGGGGVQPGVDVRAIVARLVGVPAFPLEDH